LPGAGADRIETDLAITRDDVIVLMHDRSLDRTTDGRGRVQSYEYERISQLDAGSWKGEEFAGERVPTLREALEAVDGRAVLNLELKTGSSPTSVNERIYDGMIALVREYDAFDWVVVSSFDALALTAVREREPDLRLLLLDYDPPSTNDKLALAIDFGFWAWSPSAEYISEERVWRAKEAGMSVHVGASPSSNLAAYAEWGVDGVSNNDPSILVSALERAGLRPEGGCLESAGGPPA
ncbi:MAG TPA: glycerophosphodiester phosphodiesterase family protein, partial [Trueperaceae bacterium]|nr:glycerophosphodiester phosphodiesterase family protein [Trueperaceae bacterium]